MITTLYVKTHNKTGLKYFGKTTRNPEKYKGSGKYWVRHIKKHGYDVTTTIIGQYSDIKECETVAIQFSIDNDIVNSKEWANFIQENGRDGKPTGGPGHKFTQEQLERMSEGSKKRWKDPAFREKVISSQKKRYNDNPELAESRRYHGKKQWTEERKQKHIEEMKSREHKRGYKISSPRSEEYKKKLSSSLKGKTKSLEHKENQAFLKIKKANPDFSFQSYQEFALECYNLYQLGVDGPTISTMLNVGRTAVYNAIKRHKKSTILVISP